MSDFKLETNEYGDVEECVCCGFEVPTKLFKEGYGCLEKTHRLCEVCANTFAGNAHQYPQVYDNVTLFRMMAQCTNMLLERIAKLERIIENGKV